MTGGERGFLLLTSHLGDVTRKPLTVAQFRNLAQRVRQLEKPKQTRALTAEDLSELGYGREMAQRIVTLLGEEERLCRYLQRAAVRGCVPVTRVSPDYPLQVRKRLGLEAPGCLWAKGDISFLASPAVALVGSRDLAEPNSVFAEAVGKEAARQGITLVSGNARGADRTAQQACLSAGGKVISVVADELEKYPNEANMLYLSEDSFDLPFTGVRALSRNRVIHTLGYIVFVAQCSFGIGGTWDGTMKNLQNGWSNVFCYADGSLAASELGQLGATLITASQLNSLSALQSDNISFM